MKGRFNMEDLQYRPNVHDPDDNSSQVLIAFSVSSKFSYCRQGDVMYFKGSHNLWHQHMFSDPHFKFFLHPLGIDGMDSVLETLSHLPCSRCTFEANIVPDSYALD